MRTILLRLIHYLISLGEFLYQLIIFVPGYAFAFGKKSPVYIQADGKSLRKVPAHIGLLIVEDEYSFKDLANIIVWSVTLGISYISVYDVNGEIKRNSILLQKNLDASQDEVLGQEKSSYDIQLYPSSHSLTQQSHSGPSKAHHACVHLLCMEDGHKRIVDMAQHLSHMVQAGMYKCEDIMPSNVDAFFQESMQFPDPDLCLKFGSVDSLFGYIPWQMRLTEIISFPSHKDVTYKSFLSSLSQFSNTQQRFGK